MTPLIERGRVIVYRVFDVAEEIDLGAVERAVEGTHRSRRWSVQRSTGHSLLVRNAPLTLSLGSSGARLGHDEVETEIFARMWDYGVVSIQFHLAIPQG